MGVFHPDLVGIQVRVMQRLGADHVPGGYRQGTTGRNIAGCCDLIGELKNGKSSEYEVHPEDFGLPDGVRFGACASAMREESRAMMLGVLENKGEARHVKRSSTLNAALCNQLHDRFDR